MDLMAARKEFEALLRRLTRQGWSWSWTKHHHVRLVSPKGRLYFASGSPSDVRAVRKITADLRRMGADL